MTELRDRKPCLLVLSVDGDRALYSRDLRLLASAASTKLLAHALDHAVGQAPWDFGPEVALPDWADRESIRQTSVLWLFDDDTPEAELERVPDA